MTYLFLEKPPLPSSELPLTLISLETWVLIKIFGTDAIQYLHNQLTCDIKKLNQNQYSFSAHCNVKGKMISNMYVFYYDNKKIAFIEPINICKKQIAIMQKYAIFSNVTITPDYHTILIGVAGTNARKYLNTFFDILPDHKNTVIHYPKIIIIYFNLPTERFLLIIIDKSFLTNLLKKSQSISIEYNNHYQWTALDIEAGYPCLDSKTSEYFLPQAANLDILKGISFDKGCYMGQELIARIQYRKLNKQSLYQLEGKLNWNQNILLPMPGDPVETQTHNRHWKNVGIVLQSCQIKQNNIWIQAILHKSILQTDLLRIPNTQFHNSLNIKIIKKSIN